jgi:hypothetical protein
LGFCCLIALTQCKKKNDHWSGPSNSFSCTVNGQQWVASTPPSIGGPAAMYIHYNPQTGDLSITGRRKNSEATYFELLNFHCQSVIGPGSYQLYTGDGEFQAFGDYMNNYPCGIYYHDTNNPGTLTITTLDTVNHRVVGDFTFTAVNPSCGNDSLLYVTNGHVELYY